MAKGYFIRLDDKTSCGGKVLEADKGVMMFGFAHAREGDRVSCGKDGKTYTIIGGVSYITSNGRRVAGELDSFSGCPCKAKLVPSLFTADYESDNEAAPTARRTAAPPASPAETSSPAAPRQSSFAPTTSRPTPTVFGNAEPQGPGFYIAPTSMTREQLEASLFTLRDPAVMHKFQLLNPNLNDIKAGTMIVLSDPNNTSCTYQEALLMQAAQEVKAALDPLTPEEAEFMFRHGAEIAAFTGQTSTWLGVSAVVMEKHLARLGDTLQAMERLHQESYRQHGHLKSPQFLAERRRLLSQLDAHLLNSTRLRGHTTIGDHPKLKTALGLSSKSLVHHWDKAGAPGQIPGYAKHVNSISRATQYMKTGGYIAIGMGAVASMLAIQEVCNTGTEAACEKIILTEGGKLIGSTVLGFIGGNVASVTAGQFCAAIQFTPVGKVICIALAVGTSAWTGTTVGGMAGELTGEKVYEVIQP
ncbi:PAAR domain-containing protein [Pseudomonas akapageensis]|uniref:PAAR domain-containing protein n=1 Tax=Pseudomonas akapageensis TaxID=2609961 RepID=UPI00140B2916|nr:PAAR domain-containing protein [Pseudomonas akapageensis]